MKYALTFTLCLIISFTLTGQKVDITIPKEAFYGAHVSIVMVSTDDGALVHDFAIEQEIATQDVNFQVDRTDAAQKLHLTILNDYALSYTGTPYFRALTQYDIPNEYELEDDSFVGPIPNTLPKPTVAGIYISGVNKVNEVITFKSLVKTDYHFKKRKKRMAFTYIHSPGSDLYVLLKCNNEAQYRYIYLPDAEVKQKLYLHYESLPNDLTTHTLDFPFSNDSDVWISATNTVSENWLFMKHSIKEELKEIEVYMPQGLNFNDFDVNIKPPQSRFFPFQITAHEWTGITALSNQIPPAIDTKMHATGFTFNRELDSTANDFLIDYWLGHQVPDEVPNNEAKTRQSFWYVKGKPSKHINFVLPDIPSNYYNDLLLTYPAQVIGTPKIYLTHQYPHGRIKQKANIKE